MHFLGGGAALPWLMVEGCATKVKARGARRRHIFLYIRRLGVFTWCRDSRLVLRFDTMRLGGRIAIRPNLVCWYGISAYII